MFAREASPFAAGLPPLVRLRRAYRRAFVEGTFWGDFQESYLAPTRVAGAPDRVLDAGCGQGETLELFRRLHVPVDYYGVDLAVGDPTWKFRVTAIADLHRLPFKDGSFDKIICNTVLEHVDDPTLVFSEFARVIRPGGRIFMSVPFVWHLHQEPFDRFRFTVHALRHLVAKHGLVEDEIRPMGGYFSVLRYLLNRSSLVWSQVPQPLRAVLSRLERARAAVDRWALAPIFFALDQLDRSPKLTLGYFVQASKPGTAPDAPVDPYCCPACRGTFERAPDTWRCSDCLTSYPIDAGVPVLSSAGVYEPVAGWTASEVGRKLAGSGAAQPR